MHHSDSKFDFKLNVGHSDLYLMILPCILKSIWCINILNQYDPKFDLKIKLGHIDLYLTVQWFCFISWRVFDV